MVHVGTIVGFFTTLGYLCLQSDVTALKINDGQRDANRRVRRAVSDVSNFFTMTGSEEALDLVILMDRSRRMSAYDFYTQQKMLIEEVLRQFVNIDPDRSRVAVVTFGDSVQIVFDAITTDLSQTKCEIFVEHGPWSRVLYNYTDDSQGASALPEALDVATTIFADSSRKDATKMVLLAWDGSYQGNDYDQAVRQKEILVTSYDASVFVIEAGRGAVFQQGNLERLASEEKYSGNVEHWLEIMMSTSTQLELYPSDPMRVTAPPGCALGHCDNRIGYEECICAAMDFFPCRPGDGFNSDLVEFRSCADNPCDGASTCREGNDTWLCICQPGYTGRFCEINTDECELGICRNSVGCVDGINDISCACRSGFCGTTCEDDSNCPELTPSTTETPGVTVMTETTESRSGLGLKEYLLISIPGMVVLLILICACCWACSWISKNVKEDDAEKGVKDDIYDDTVQKQKAAAGVSGGAGGVPVPLRLQTRFTRGVPAAARELGRRISRKSSLYQETSPIRPLEAAAVTSPNPATRAENEDRYRSAPALQPSHVKTGRSKPPPPPKPSLKPKTALVVPIPVGMDRTPPGTPAKLGGRFAQPVPAIEDIYMPSPPPGRQKTAPDVVRESCHYQNLPHERNMAPWVDYVSEMTEAGIIDKLCVVSLSGESDQWITTQRDFLINSEEIQLLLKTFSKKHVKKDLNFKRVLYTINTNNGSQLLAVSGNNVCLCVGRTKRYLVCLISEAGDRDGCLDEMQYIQEHIKADEAKNNS